MPVVMVMPVMMVVRSGKRGVGAKEHQNGNDTD
jgi:hypothetical protein